MVLGTDQRRELTFLEDSGGDRSDGSGIRPAA
jgi:hypothetical protein